MTKQEIAEMLEKLQKMHDELPDENAGGAEPATEQASAVTKNEPSGSARQEPGKPATKESVEKPVDNAEPSPTMQKEPTTVQPNIQTESMRKPEQSKQNTSEPAASMQNTNSVGDLDGDGDSDDLDKHIMDAHSGDANGGEPNDEFVSMSKDEPPYDEERDEMGDNTQGLAIANPQGSETLDPVMGGDESSIDAEMQKVVSEQPEIIAAQNAKIQAMQEEIEALKAMAERSQGAFGLGARGGGNPLTKRSSLYDSIEDIPKMRKDTRLY